MRTNLPVTSQEYPLRDGITIVSRTDLKGRITYVNDDFLEASGFPEAELIGQAHNIVHPTCPKRRSPTWWRTLQAGRPWTGLGEEPAQERRLLLGAGQRHAAEGRQLGGGLHVGAHAAHARGGRSGRGGVLPLQGEDGQGPGDPRRPRREDGARGSSIRCSSRAWATRALAVLGMAWLLVATGAALAAATGSLPAAAGAALLAVLALAGMGAWPRLRRTLVEMSGHLEGYAQGRFDGIVDARGHDELAQSMLALKRLQTRLGFEFDTRKRAEESHRIRQALDAAATNAWSPTPATTSSTPTPRCARRRRRRGRHPQGAELRRRAAGGLEHRRLPQEPGAPARPARPPAPTPRAWSWAGARSTFILNAVAVIGRRRHRRRMEGHDGRAGRAQRRAGRRGRDPRLVQAAADGDLTRRLDTESRSGFYRTLAEGFGNQLAVETVSKTIVQVRAAADLPSASAQVSQTSQSLSHSASRRPPASRKPPPRCRRSRLRSSRTPTAPTSPTASPPRPPARAAARRRGRHQTKPRR
ncbi:MAG: hypothetical protein U1F25_18735 [Rubrivivax sp.]